MTTHFPRVMKLGGRTNNRALGSRQSTPVCSAMMQKLLLDASSRITGLQDFGIKMSTVVAVGLKCKLLTAVLHSCCLKPLSGSCLIPGVHLLSLATGHRQCKVEARNHHHDELWHHAFTYCLFRMHVQASRAGILLAPAHLAQFCTLIGQSRWSS